VDSKRKKLGKIMRIHYIQHHPAFEVGSIAHWAQKKKHQLTGTDLSKGELIPELGEFDMLISLGGPMGAYEEGRHLWIKQERSLMGEAIVAGKLILAFGLGAQILSQALRGGIHKNPYREIGFGEVRFNKDGQQSPLLIGLPEKITVLHWHKDLFEVPRDGHLLAKSKGCKSQGFRFHDRVMGFQFHLETTPEIIEALIKKCRGDIVKGQFVQSPDELIVASKKCKNMNGLLERILDNYEEKFSSLSSTHS
jgi:GMP synthase-like glutamine amidotransferase